MSKLDVVDKFKCRVTEIDSYFGESSQGNPCLAIPLEVIEGEHEGKTITKYLSLVKSEGKDGKITFDRTIETLAEVFGFNGDLEALYQGEISFTGMECRIKTELEEYKGEKQVKVAWLNHVDNTGGLKPLDEAKLKSLVRSDNDRAKAVAQKVLGENQQNIETHSSTGQDEDFPF